VVEVKYKRVLLKLSGEVFGGKQKYGIDPQVLQVIAKEIKKVKKYKVDVAVVAGGGNIFRGLAGSASGMDRATGDYMGMLATVINALALQDSLENEGVITRTQSAISMQAIAEPYIRRRAIRHLEKKRAVIFAGGTGNPYMTTDTAAALRAIEIGADVLLMAKNKVDGIYDSDPLKNPKAKKFDYLTHREALNLHLDVMDITAFSLCQDNRLPIIIFDLRGQQSIERAISGEHVGTFVTTEKKK